MMDYNLSNKQAELVSLFSVLKNENIIRLPAHVKGFNVKTKNNAYFPFAFVKALLFGNCFLFWAILSKNKRCWKEIKPYLDTPKK